MTLRVFYKAQEKLTGDNAIPVPPNDSEKTFVKKELLFPVMSRTDGGNIFSTKTIFPASYMDPVPPTDLDQLDETLEEEEERVPPVKRQTHARGSSFIKRLSRRATSPARGSKQ